MNSMVIFVLCFCLVMLLISVIVLFPILNFIKKHNSSTKRIINHDINMQSFCYKTAKSTEEIWACLRVNSIYDSLRYHIDIDNRTITFYSELTKGYPPVCYTIRITPSEDCTLIKITQIDKLFSNNIYRYSLNEFWRKKLDAKPVPYFNIKEQ